MNNPIYLRAWGDLACFTRPEMKVERVSYPVITPSAARGLLEAILYKPQVRWRIHRIAVRRPIQFLAFRRNEVKSKASRNPEPIFADEDRTQRNTLALRQVDYVIEASLALTPLAGRPRLLPAGLCAGLFLWPRRSLFRGLFLRLRGSGRPLPIAAAPLLV